MASFSIVVIPQDKDFLPQPAATQAAAVRLASFYPDRHEEVRCSASQHPRLITSRDGFEELVCPACGETVARFELDEDDEGETWWDRFEQQLASSDQADQAQVAMPCCGESVAAGDIDFMHEACFARFEMSLRDPGGPLNLTPAQMASLADDLGCPVAQLCRVHS